MRLMRLGVCCRSGVKTWGMRWDNGGLALGDDVTLSAVVGEELHRRSGGVGWSPLPKRPSSSIHKSECLQSWMIGILYERRLI
jgi:hypothetical protein